MKLQNIKKGFTLVELLVVITIIGILAVGGVQVFTTQLQWARDSTRIKQIWLLEWASIQYFSDYSEYPTPASFTGDIARFVSKELKDPKSGLDVCWQNGSTATSDGTCEGLYHRTDDTYNLPNAAFKIGVRFEKEVNFETQAANTSDGWNDVEIYEKYAWAGSETIDLQANGTKVY